MLFKFLSKGQPLSEYYFKVPKMCLNPLGFWPLSVHSNMFMGWSFVSFTVLFVGVVTELHAGFRALVHHQFEYGLDTLCPGATSAVTLLKMAFILYYSTDLQYIYTRIQELQLKFKDYKMKHKSQEGLMNGIDENNLSELCCRTSRFIFLPFMMGLITCTAYNLKPIFMAFIFWWQGKSMLWTTPFNMTLPSFLMESPFFPFTYLFTALTGYITVYFFSGCDGFYFEFCSHIVVLLKLLQEDLKGVFRKHTGKMDLTESESTEMEYSLANIVECHNDIIVLTEYFCKCYSTITLAHFLSASLVIGMSIFDLLTFSGMGQLIYIFYTFAVLGQLFIYCYGGQMVEDNSVEIASVLLNCDWYVCNPKLRRMLLVILIRSQRTMTMKVPFFAPKLLTLAKILKTSGSVIALASSFRSN